jgi:choline monooxygenase
MQKLPVQEKVTLDDLSQVKQPIEKARGMPNPSYTDEEVFQFERDQILAKNWAVIAFVNTLENNMIRPVDFMGLPILLTKTSDGEIKVFHNVCSHRGMKLVDEPRTTNGLIVCPYHSWTYSVQGELKATPHIGGVGEHKLPGFACEGRGLKSIRSHIWLGILFINLDGNADEFEEDAEVAISRARDLMGAEGESQLQPPASNGELSIEVNCNWKLAIENYLEAYHLPFIHPGLNSYSPLSEHYCEIHSSKSSGQITTTFDPKLDSENPLPMFSQWDPERLSNGDYPVVYPNLLLGFQANHIFAMIIHPVDAKNCREELGIFYVDDGASSQIYEDARKVNLEDWSTVFSEDIGPCERMQIGRQSPGYFGGAFSPKLDRCSHHFHQWIATQYESAYVRDGEQ